jgi:hypothetical protein
VRAKRIGGALLSFLFVTSLIAIPSFIAALTSFQPASANSTQENFTIIALPDTQYYSQSYPEVFENQTNWIVQNENKLNIVFVAHLGDLVEHSGNDYEWVFADQAMSILDNAKIPYGILPGNHDIDPDGSAMYYSEHFPASRYEGRPYWGGSYDNGNMNNYQLFSAGGMNFIVIDLQYNPPTDVLSWADNVLTKYSYRRAIISTHSYLDLFGNRGVGGPVIYRDLVVPHSNVFLVLCGHVYDDVTGYAAKEKIDNIDGRIVYQLLSDYQGMRPNGGNGWLRIMQFVPSENTIYVNTYSPYLDNYWPYNDNSPDPAEQFQLYYPMSETAVTGGGGISLMVYLGAVLVIVVVIAAVLAARQYRPGRLA